MTTSIYRFFALLLFLFAPATATADEILVDLGEPGVLVLPLHDGWEYEILPGREDGPPTVRLQPPGGVSFTALITPIWREVADVSDFGTRRGVYRIVGNLATAVSLTSVESQLKIEKFGGRRVGYWFFATDKSLVQQTPPPDEYLYLVQGALMVGDLFCKFTMLTNDKPSRETELMFKLLLDAAHRTGT